ncbi:MAG TPA: pseudouridine synthase [Dehalococcoidia bacterium]|nr:pseudouridine synthase [Dehalococcoidia bacterium]
MTEERLQKVLAEAGVASRRAAERMIADGRVGVNGEIVKRMGTLADPERDAITVDGTALGPPPEPVYLVVNKPRGYVTTTRDERGRPVVMDLVYKTRERVFPVGRLDMDSEGLLLLTNDGELAQRLTHPSHEVDKEYLALMSGTPDAKALRELRRGIALEGRRTAPATAEVIPPPSGMETGAGQTWLRVVLKEGRKRQVRLMCEAVGHPVERLIRVRIGPLRLRGLVPGRVRELTPNEIERIREAAGLVGGRD